MVLGGLKAGIRGAIGLLQGRRKLDEELLAEVIKRLRRALIEADFNIRQTKDITERLEERLREGEPRQGLALDTHAMNIIYAELVRLLGPAREFRPHNQTVLMVGLYGQGKTTTAAKLADWWRRRHGARVAVIAADVHRPGAATQLQQLLADTGVAVHTEPDTPDAPTIVRNGLATYGGADVIIIDTAGRHQLDEELVTELDEISRLANATERFLVIDAQVGQAAGPVAASFHSLVNVTGVIVTKLDGTARGGGALSAVAATAAPIMWVGTGETIRELEAFESDRFISRLLGMGDIKGLIDLAPEDLDELAAVRLTERLMSGRFTLHDMYQQMEMMSKVGTLSKLLSFLPDMFGGGMSEAQKKGMQRNLDRYRIIMDSMTSQEKNEPHILKSERVRRIARGSGVREKDVRDLLGQWNRSRRMMKGMKGNRGMQRQMRQMMDGNDLDDLGIEGLLGGGGKQPPPSGA